MVAVSKILRHSDPMITVEVYGHLEPAYLRSAIDLLSLRLPEPPELANRDFLLPGCYPPPTADC